MGQRTKRLDNNGEKMNVRGGALNLSYCALDVTIWSSVVFFRIPTAICQEIEDDESDERCC